MYSIKHLLSSPHHPKIEAHSPPIPEDRPNIPISQSAGVTKVKPFVFHVGDLMLKENPKNQVARERKGKWEANWIGPYIIIESFETGTYRLSDCDDTDLAEPINNIHLKWFYV